jgi:eukaryotic-like serine/threonine-protein kinase
METNSAAPRPLPHGACLNGVFKIDARIASGGASEIYRGHVVETGDPVAIKMMPRDVADNPMALALFRKEASALHHIQHEAIVRCYLFSHDPGTRRHYLAMEFVDGQPLSEILRQGPLGFGAVRILQERLAAGLSAVHQHGIIHRDLSPDNVLIPRRDLARAKIIGFDIARSTWIGDSIVIGSAFASKYNFVSPEQLGLFGGEATAKSDIYSLGLVFAACLIGQPIDMGCTQLEILEKRRAVPDLQAIDRRFRPLLEKMLEPNPANRAVSMAAVAAWRPAPAAEPRRAAAHGRGSAAATRPAPRRAAWLVQAVLAVMLLLGVASAGFYYAHYLSPLVVALPRFPEIRFPDLNLSDRQPPDLKVPDVKRPDFDPSVTRPVKDSALRPMSPLEQPATDPRQRIIEFINAYDGGDCFFVTPEAVDEGKATLDGLGSSVAPFEVLDYEFKRHNGFEASIGVHQVMSEQCPAVSFLFHTRQQRGDAPRLDVVTAGLRNGVLKGVVSAFGDGNVALLLTGDDGYVRNVTSLLKSNGNVKTFAMGLTRTNPGPPRPQLLIVIASPRPLAALALPADGSLAGEVFPQILAEVSQTGQPLSVSAKYFMLER